ncbi:DUF4395 domain-containing protein [Mycobacterium seoulense]|uniref:DUF4395 domain-containing protein n=1 Tax=Mycobacterium seoulense TaxID=386911 RepID=A0A7I7P1L5_9MYCO|nr:DUF4395 domain-containing protein [Mycobacterium seoulense]BBY01932.1 hypothetical protein MSEO_24310 [Mycobacterium seoulense]
MGSRPVPLEHAFLNTPWWAMGQITHAHAEPRINEVATRARAGLLNIISAITIALLLLRPETDPVIIVGPLVLFDMLAAAVSGLTPFSPTGILGTALTMGIRPVWKPTRPKRFAWLLGAGLAATCLAMRLLGASPVAMAAVVAVCFVLTWSEATLGFCVGCYMHKLIWGCQDCEVPYVREIAPRPAISQERPAINLESRA